MSTPEALLKKKIRDHLRSLGARVFSPVQRGMGGPALDIIACVNGKYVEIEAKNEGKKPTPRQEATAKEVVRAGGVAFCADSFESYLGSMTLYGFINQPQQSMMHPSEY